MKRLSLILGMMTMGILASCSTDEFDTDVTTDATEDAKLNQKGVYLKRIVTTTNAGSTVNTSDYLYSGSKLARINSSDGTHVVYTYTGNLITERAYYYNNTLNTKEIFQYNDNSQLLSYRRVNPSNTVLYTALYQYNSDGTVSVSGYRGSTIVESSKIVNRKVFVVNGQVNKIENYTISNGSAVTEVLNYTFDTKNSPFKDILGFDKLTYYDTALNGSARNVTGINTVGASLANSGNDIVQYTYNAQNYPVTADKGSIVFQYTY